MDHSFQGFPAPGSQHFSAPPSVPLGPMGVDPRMQQPSPFGAPPSQQAPGGASGDFGTNSFVSSNFESLAPVAASAAFDYGSKKLQVVEGSVNKGFGFLRYYFDVNTRYVGRKLLHILFPFVNRKWKRLSDSDEIGSQSISDHPKQFAPPRSDLNAPDLYIPLMSLVTYVLLVGYCIGHSNVFSPEVLGDTVSRGLAMHAFGVLILWLGSYLTISSSPSIIDLVAFSGYIFPSIIVNILAFLLFGQTAYWAFLLYTTSAYALFLVQSLSQLAGREKTFLYFVLGYCVAQYFISWFLGRSALYYFPAPTIDDHNIRDVLADAGFPALQADDLALNADNVDPAF